MYRPFPLIFIIIYIYIYNTVQYPYVRIMSGRLLAEGISHVFRHLILSWRLQIRTGMILYFSYGEMLLSILVSFQFTLIKVPYWPQ